VNLICGLPYFKQDDSHPCLNTTKRWHVQPIRIDHNLLASACILRQNCTYQFTLCDSYTALPIASTRPPLLMPPEHWNEDGGFRTEKEKKKSFIQTIFHYIPKGKTTYSWFSDVCKHNCYCIPPKSWGSGRFFAHMIAVVFTNVRKLQVDHTLFTSISAKVGIRTTPLNIL